MRISSSPALWNPLKKFQIKRVFTWRDIYIYICTYIYTIYMARYIYKDVCGEACPAKVCLLSEATSAPAAFCTFLIIAFFRKLPHENVWCGAGTACHSPPLVCRSPSSACHCPPQSATACHSATPPLLTALLLQGQQQRLLWWATRWRRDLPCRTGPAGVPCYVCVFNCVYVCVCVCNFKTVTIRALIDARIRMAYRNLRLLCTALDLGLNCNRNNKYKFSLRAPTRARAVSALPSPPPLFPCSALHTRISMATIEFKWLPRSVPFRSVPAYFQFT